ncbi:MAG: hypothetical protein RLN81_00085 [Balneolaceae bacterium]
MLKKLNFDQVSIKRKLLNTVSLITLILFLNSGLSLNAQTIKLPKPSGNFQVGTVSYTWSDQREEIATPDLNKKREFYVRIWYPTDLEADAKHSDYMPQLDSFGTMVGENFVLRIKKTQTNSYKNQQVSKEKSSYPVVIFSPGYGMSKYYYTHFLEELASRGYIVVAVDFPYLNKLVTTKGVAINPDGNFWNSFPVSAAAEGSYEDAKKKVEMTLEYFSSGIFSVKNELENLNRSDPKGIFTERIDLKKIALFGHSAGALGVKGVMELEDTPFLGFITFDVSIHQVIGSREIIIPHTINITTPVLMFITEYASPPDYDFLKSVSTNIEMHSLSGMNHSSLSDLDYLYYLDNNQNQQAELALKNIRIITSVTVRFLNKLMSN